jgi:hypothetical protein
MTQGPNLPRQLSLVSFITECGSWLSFFAILVAIDSLTGDPASAALTAPLIHVGSTLGAVITAFLLVRFPSNRILTVSQISAGLSVAAISASLAFGQPVPTVAFYALVVLIYASSRQLAMLRPIYLATTNPLTSAALRSPENNVQRLNFTTLAKGITAAQIVGPTVALILLSMGSPPYLLLAVDAATYLAAGIVCLKLPSIRIKKPTLFDAIQTVKIKGPGQNIFAIRTVIWVFFAGSNTAIIVLIAKNISSSIANTTLTNIALGIGGTIAAWLLTEKAIGLRSRIGQIGDSKIALLALGFLAITRITIAGAASLAELFVMYVLAGVAVQAHLVCSQAIRERSVSRDSFASYLTVEESTAGAISLLAGLFFTYSMSSGFISPATVLYISAFGFILCGLMYRAPALRNV